MSNFLILKSEFHEFFLFCNFCTLFLLLQKRRKKSIVFLFLLYLNVKSSELYKFPTDNSCIPERSMDVGQIRAKGNQSTLKFGEIGPTQVKLIYSISKKMLEIHCIKNARNQKSTFDLRKAKIKTQWGKDILGPKKIQVYF